MLGKRSTRFVRLVAGAMFVVAALGSAATPVAAADQLQDTAIATYELRPDRGVVHVTTVFTLTNRAPGTSKHWDCSYIALDPYGNTYLVKSTCTRRTTYYYDGYDFWLERDATRFRVTADSGSVSLHPSKRKGNWRVVQLHFSKLQYGKTRKVTLTYDLPAGGPRSTNQRRAGYVYSTFCASGPGSDRGRLKVVMPAGFVMAVSERIGSTTAKGTTTYDSGPMQKDPWKLYPCFEGENRDGFASASFPLADGHTAKVESWKEDRAWAAAVSGAVASDLPAMMALVGAPPIGSDLTIRERRAGLPTIDNPTTHTHQISEALATRAAVTDDLAHLWLSSSDVRGEWLVEGYAAWIAHQAGVSQATCDKPGALPTSRQELDQWTRIRSGSSQIDRDNLAYQRQAACYVMAQVAAAIGTERMAETLHALQDRRDPWHPTDTPQGAAQPTWRTWADTITEYGYRPASADPSGLSALLVDYGVEDDPLTMAAHDEAHAAYHELATLIGEAPAPKAVIDALAQWDFAAANRAIAAATAAWKDTATVGAVLPSIDVANSEIRLAVSNAASVADLEAAAGKAATQASDASAVADALAVQDAAVDPLQRLGLIGTTLPSAATLIDAVAHSDSATATSGAALISSSVGAARDVGLQRAIAAVAAVIVLIAAGWFVRRVRRRRSTPTEEAATS